MSDKEKNCPLCHSTVTYFGEGGYGKCANDSFTFEQKIEGCETEACKDTYLKEEKDIHSAND